MSAGVDSFNARMIARHSDEVADGKHDEQCEFGTDRETASPFTDAVHVTRMWMCHCSKRRREAAGYTESPGPVIQQMPMCPRCFQETNWDDGFQCDACCVRWSDTSPDAPGEFFDDYGDLGKRVVDVHLPASPSPSLRGGPSNG